MLHSIHHYANVATESQSLDDIDTFRKCLNKKLCDRLRTARNSRYNDIRQLDLLTRAICIVRTDKTQLGGLTDIYNKFFNNNL